MIITVCRHLRHHRRLLDSGKHTSPGAKPASEPRSRSSDRHRCSSQRRDGAGLAVRLDPPASAQLFHPADHSFGGSRHGCSPAVRRSQPQSPGGPACGPFLTRRLRRSRSLRRSARRMQREEAPRLGLQTVPQWTGRWLRRASCHTLQVRVPH